MGHKQHKLLPIKRQAVLLLQLHPTLWPPMQALMFEAAARAHPEDGELHSALGVVYNLARRYDDAVEAFRWAGQEGDGGRAEEGFGKFGLGWAA